MADATLLNHQRPPVFCPGCSHDNALKVLDKAFINLGFAAEDICMVSDIGCSGLFDTFFNTHAFHGVHGRGADLRHRHEDVPPGVERGRHHGRRRPWHRRGPRAGRLPAQHRHDPFGAEQLQLRHDRRPVLGHHPQRRGGGLGLF